MTKKQAGTRAFTVDLAKVRRVAMELQELADIAKSISDQMSGFNGEYEVFGGERVWETVVEMEDDDGKLKPSRTRLWLDRVMTGFRCTPEYREKAMDGLSRRKK